MAVFDIRAKLYSAIGPVISGSVSEDHAQGKGLILCGGEITLAGLRRPAIGTPVQLAYQPAGSDRLVRFPRQLFVMSSFANPFEDTTNVELGCKLTLQKGVPANKEFYRSIADEFKNYSNNMPKTLKARRLLRLAASSLGMDIIAPAMNKSFLWDDGASMPASTVELIDNILNTELAYGYADLEGNLQCGRLQGSEQFAGPLVPLESVISLAPTTGGGEPVTKPTYSASPSVAGPKPEPAVPAADGTAPVVTAPSAVTSTPRPTAPVDTSDTSYLDFLEEESNPSEANAVPPVAGDSATSPSIPNPASPSTQKNPGWSSSWSETTSRVRIYREFPGLEIDQYFSGTERTESYEEHSIEGQLLSRVSTKSGYGAKDNGQIVLDYLIKAVSLEQSADTQQFAESWRAGANKYGNAKTFSYKEEFFQYEAVLPPPLTPSERDALTAAGETDTREPTFRVIAKQEYTYIGILETLGKMGIKDYSKVAFPDFPSPVCIQRVEETYFRQSGQEKVIRDIYLAYGVTEQGQQYISKALSKYKAAPGEFINLYPALESFAEMVFSETIFETRSVDPNETQLNTNLVDLPISKVPLAGESEQLTVEPVVAAPGAIATPISREEFTPPMTEFIPDAAIAAAAGATPAEQEKAAIYGIKSVRPETTEETTGGLLAYARYLQEYAVYQNSLRFAHRLGAQFTTPIGVLPSFPLSPFYVSLNGVSALYLTNAASWAFDANGLVQSIDALYWGAAGGEISGAGWVPLPPSTTVLPAAPVVVSQTPNPPIYSDSYATEDLEALSGGAPETSNDRGSVTAAVTSASDYGRITAPVTLGDGSDIGSIAAGIAALPTTGTEVFAEEVAPVNVIKPFKQIWQATGVARLRCSTVDVYGPAVRDQGPVATTVRLKLSVAQAVEAVIHPALAGLNAPTLSAVAAVSVEVNPTLSGGFGLGGNLS